MFVTIKRKNHTKKKQTKHFKLVIGNKTDIKKYI